MSREVTYIAHSENEKPYPPTVHLKGHVVRTSVAELTVSDDLFSIAETSGLPQNYYEIVSLDERFPSDKRRAQLLRDVESNNQVPPNIVAMLRSADKDVLEPWYRGVPIEQLVSPTFELTNEEEFRDLTTRFLNCPPELAAVVYDDPTSALEVIDIIGGIQGLFEVADIDAISATVRKSLNNLEGDERIAQLQAMKDSIEEALSLQKTYESEVSALDSEEGRKLQNKRIMRKRYVSDGLDVTLFRLGANNGVIVNPSYLHDPTYYELLGHDEPNAHEEDEISFLRHMMSGHWSLGQDHTFLYLNTAERQAATLTGTLPDYFAVRPGNFLFHDLKLLEYGPYDAEPLSDCIFEYVRHSYFRQMDLSILDPSLQPSEEVALNICIQKGDTRYVAPLERNEEHVIPFRALRKNLEDKQYYEYGSECYMAELVDIALQLDAINEPKETSDVTLGQYSSRLIDDLYYTSEGSKEATALALEQLMFMKGQSVLGGREEIIRALQQPGGSWREKISTLNYQQETIEAGEPLVRPPLTCYYEWFQRFARPVSREEMQRRNLAMTL